MQLIITSNEKGSFHSAKLGSEKISKHEAYKILNVPYNSHRTLEYHVQEYINAFPEAKVKHCEIDAS